MKESLLQYAAYNVWANKLMIGTMMKLEATAVDQEIVSSFPTIRKTVLHCWSAEYVWLQRLQLAEKPVWVQNDFQGPFEEACTNWQKASADILQFVEKQYDDKALQHVVQFYDLQKTSHKMPVFEVLHHVFNHATYHRGQLVTMLRQAGVTEIPRTDFIVFARKK